MNVLDDHELVQIDREVASSRSIENDWNYCFEETGVAFGAMNITEEHFSYIAKICKCFVFITELQIMKLQISIQETFRLNLFLIYRIYFLISVPASAIKQILKQIYVQLLAMWLTIKSVLTAIMQYLIENNFVSEFHFKFYCSWTDEEG